MIFLRIRKLGIDVIPNGMPFVSLVIEKVFYNEEIQQEIQVIGNYDRIVKKFSDIGIMPIGTIADDNYIDPYELYELIAQTAYPWIMEKHGGQMIDEKLVVDE